jgi:hypothetical protein
MFSRLTDAQGTVVAALITSILSLIVSLGTAYYSHQSAKEFERFKQGLQIENQRRKEIDTALKGSWDAIQEMKDAISQVANGLAPNPSEGRKILDKAAANLLDSYKKSGLDVSGSDPAKKNLREAFHTAKNYGLEAADLVKPTASEVSPETQGALRRIRDQLTLKQLELEVEYDRKKQPHE